MAGETVKTEAICIGIHPWSRTSHVTSWLTPDGRILTVVKGAVRPKSAFLGQYDLNYTCEILYYARAHGEMHALRECSPTDIREYLRADYRALMLAEYCRFVCAKLTPSGPEAADWYRLLTDTLDSLRGLPASRLHRKLLEFDRSALTLAGLWPEEGPNFPLDADRAISVLYTSDLELSPEPRETVLGMICKPELRTIQAT